MLSVCFSFKLLLSHFSDSIHIFRNERHFVKSLPQFFPRTVPKASLPGEGTSSGSGGPAAGGPALAKGASSGGPAAGGPAAVPKVGGVAAFGTMML